MKRKWKILLGITSLLVIGGGVYASVRWSQRGIVTVQTGKVVRQMDGTKDAGLNRVLWNLRGNPPVGTCTICVGKKEIGWKQHFGVVRPLDTEMFYRGE